MNRSMICTGGSCVGDAVSEDKLDYRDHLGLYSPHDVLRPMDGV